MKLGKSSSGRERISIPAAAMQSTNTNGGCLLLVNRLDIQTMQTKNEIGEERIKMRSSRGMLKVDKYGHSTLQSRDYGCFIVISSQLCNQPFK